MKNTNSKFSLAAVFITLSIAAFSQNYSEQARIYFKKNLESSTIMNLCTTSFPTIEDCNLVFKGQNAYTYFGFIEDMKSIIKEEQKKASEKFVDVRIEFFTTSDIEQGKGNYAGGMKDIANKIQSNVTFYKINYLREIGAETGLAYEYWIKIDNRWVFFPKPYRAFEK